MDKLSKSYGKVKALTDLTLEVHRGEIFGYLGPNGAGKSTTIRLLLDLIRPTGGQASILGMDVHRESVRLHQHLGNLPGELTLWNHMTGWEVVRYLGKLRGGVDTRYLSGLIDRLDINMERKVKDCSSGMKRKLGILQALMHKPDILILDEPTNGLDPLMQQIFYQLMNEVRAEGRTVFMSSHNLPEVEHICDRVGILREGRLQAVESMSKLKQVHFRWIGFDFSDPVDTNEFAHLKGVSAIKADNGHLRFRITGELDEVMKVAARHHIKDLEYREPNLEEIFLEYYGGKES
jgi:ABC-2 type transport system ATP-binding protein